MPNDLIEIRHNAVLGGKVSLKLDGHHWLERLVDTFLTAAQSTFTVSLRPAIGDRRQVHGAIR
jgi:hypothetical protein